MPECRARSPRAGCGGEDRSPSVRATKPPAVFLDRDGVLVEEVNYLGRIEDVRIIPGAPLAVRKLNEAGWPVVVVTNQAGVARGYFPESQVGVIHDFLIAEFARLAGAKFDRFDYSPYHPTEGVGEFKKESDCRKPNPGMLLRSASALDLDLRRSWMIGDKLSDLEAGASAGCKTILVRTGYGAKSELTVPNEALNLVVVVPSLVEAVEIVLRTGRIEARPTTGERPA